jgi:hypothetical protein
MRDNEHYAYCDGNMQKTKYGMWYSKVVLHIGNRTFNQVIMQHTKRDLKAKITNKDYLQKWAESHIFTKDGLIQLPMGL